MPGSALLFPGPKAFAGLAVTGLALSIALTQALCAGSGGVTVGFLFVCTIAAVPPPDFPGVLTTFAFEPIPVFMLLTIGAGYLLVFRDVHSGPQRRLASTGRLVLLRNWTPARAAHRLRSAGRVQQHLPHGPHDPALRAHHDRPAAPACGCPATLLLVASGRDVRARWLYPLLHARWFSGFTNPLVGLVLFAVIPVGWYISPAFELSLTNVWLHYLGYGIFLFAGVHYWWPIVGVNPSRWNLSHPIRVAYLFALVPIHAFWAPLLRAVTGPLRGPPGSSSLLGPVAAVRPADRRGDDVHRRRDARADRHAARRRPLGRRR